MSNNDSSSIIVLAWPETEVRRIGVWYDQVTRWLGFIKGDYYKAGHAAAVLVDRSTGQLKYFDFGRYHTPEKMGRLRSDTTDPELKFRATAVFQNDGEIGNIEEILTEIVTLATHGDGTMYASVAYTIDWGKAMTFTGTLQRAGLVNYGPFDLRGTNCSRFVRDVVRSSTRSVLTKIRLSIPWMLTPATKWNVLNVNSQGAYYEVNDQIIVHNAPSVFKRLELLIAGMVKKDSVATEPVLILDNSQNTCSDGNC